MRYSVYYTKSSILIKLAIAAIDTFLSFFFLTAKAIVAFLYYKWSKNDNSGNLLPSDASMVSFKSFGFTF